MKDKVKFHFEITPIGEEILRLHAEMKKENEAGK